MSFTNHEIQTAVEAIEARFKPLPRKQSSDQFSDLARFVMLTNTSNTSTNASNSSSSSPPPESVLPSVLASTSTPKDSDKLQPPSKTAYGRASDESNRLQPNGAAIKHGKSLTDTPLPSTPGSPHM